MSQQKRRLASRQTGVYLAIVGATLILGNVFFAGTQYRKDFTRGERYTLTTGSGRLIRNLKAPVTAEVYVTRGMAKLDVYVDDLLSLLKEYEQAGAGKFRLVVIETDTEENKQRAQEAQLQPMALVNDASSKTEIAQGYMGIVFKYGKETEVIPRLNPASADGLEFVFTNKLRELRDRADDIHHKIGLISGKGEIKLSDEYLVPKKFGEGYSIERIIKQNFPFYDTESVDITKTETISSDLSGVIITAPQESFTADELKKIDHFLMAGDKSLVVIAGAYNSPPHEASMSGELDLKGLSPLLDGYGIKLNKDVVIDYGAPAAMLMQSQSGAVGQVVHPGIILADDNGFGDEESQMLDTSFPSFFELSGGITFPFASSIEIEQSKQSQSKFQVVARSSESATLVTESPVDMRNGGWRTAEDEKSYPIAVSLSGALHSAFGEGKSATASRVLVIASSQFITNPFAYAGGAPELGGQFQGMGDVGSDQELLDIAAPYAQQYMENSILVMKNTFDWMSGDADLLGVSSKIAGSASLKYADLKAPKFESGDDESAIKSKQDDYRQSLHQLQSLIQWNLTLGVPALFALFGLLRWRRRESRRADYKLN